MYGLQSTNCDKDKVSKTIYSWNPVKGDYDACQLDVDLSPGQCLEVVKAAWVFNGGNDCNMNSILGVAADYNISLASGWNMLSVLPQWEYKKISDIIPERCGFLLGWAYDAVEGWKQIDKDAYPNSIPASRVGKGFWAYIGNSCSFLAG